MARKKRNKRSSPEKKRIAFQPTRWGAVTWLCVIVIISAWTFVLGILVGRETAPLKFDIEKLEKKLAALKAVDFRKELQRFSIDSNVLEEKPDLGFYEALIADTDDVKLSSESVATKSQTVSPNVRSKEAKRKVSGKQNGASKKPMETARKSDPSPKKLTVQVASVKNLNDAGKMIISLKKKGFPAYLAPATIPGQGKWYRVRVGPFTTDTEANTTLNSLKKERFKGIILKY
jgi:cell division septation protein DedD